MRISTQILTDQNVNYSEITTHNGKRLVYDKFNFQEGKHPLFLVLNKHPLQYIKGDPLMVIEWGKWEDVDYKRNGTTTLFAALDVLEGKVIGRCMQRHRHQEFIRFLNAIEAEVPAGKIVHVILDNYGTHKHPKVVAWLERHPRFVFHFTPTSCSWLNAVETFFAKLSKRRLKRGVFHSIINLQPP